MASKSNEQWAEITLDDLSNLTKEVLNGTDKQLDTRSDKQSTGEDEEDEYEVVAKEEDDPETLAETGDDEEDPERVKEKDDTSKRDVSGSSEERIKQLYAANKQNEEKVANLERTLKEREEALSKAKTSESTLRKGELEYRKSSIESETTAIKKALKEARIEGDVDLETELFEKLQHKIIEKKLVESSISDFSDEPEVARETVSNAANTNQNTAQSANPEFPAEAQKFVTNNPWIAQDAGARDIVARAAQNFIDAGLDPNTKEFYDKLAPALEGAFKSIGLNYKVVHDTPKPKVKSPVLGKETASEETPSSFVRQADGKFKAKVTPDDKEMAHRMGMDVKTYMQAKFKTEKQNKGNVSQWTQIEA